MADQHNGDGPRHPSEPPLIPLWPWAVTKIKYKLQDRRARRQNENSQDRLARRTANATAWIAILAVIAAVVSSLQYLTFQSQLTEMKDEQRPWVYADWNVAGAPYRNDDGGWAFPVTVTYHNTGRLPAMNVLLDTEEFLWPPDVILKKLGLRDRQKKRCDFPTPLDQNHVGLAIFPGQAFNDLDEFDISKEEIEKLSVSLKNSGKELTFVAPVAVGCIRYRAPDNNPHQTGVALNIIVQKPGESSVRAFPLDPTSVDPVAIRFDLLSIDGIAYAN